MYVTEVLEESANRANMMLNDEMREDFFSKQDNLKYREMMDFRKKLPAFDKRLVKSITSAS